MATYDPVLDRKMFKAKEKPSKVRGIVDLGEEEMVDTVDEGDYEARREMAMKMLAAAREKQNPSNFNTLSETERPMVFRPAAVNLPQPQQPVPAAQQMAQMQAAGIRPAGMAHGGIVRQGYDGEEGSLVSPSGPVGLESLRNITSEERRRLSPKDNEAIEKAQAAEFDLRTFGSGKLPENLLTDPDTGQTPEEKEDLRLAMKGKVPYDQYQLEGGLNDAVTYNRPEDPSTWTPGFKEAMIDKIHQEKVAEVKSLPEFKRTAVPSRENIERQVDQSIVDAKVRKGETFATTDALARERAMPNVALGEGRDFAGDRLSDTLRRAKDPYYGYGRDSVRVEDAQQAGRQKTSSMETSRREEVARINEDQALRDQAMPDKRDYAQGREGLASLGRIAEDKALRDQAMPDKRDYAQERKAATIPGVPGAGAAKDQAGGPAVAQEPPKYAPSTTLESIKSDRAKEREDNFNMALIQAGLAMMGGKSSNALANIGEGGMQGIKQFSEQEREANRGYREDVKGIRDEQRFGDEMAQRERMQTASLGATADLAKATRDASAAQQQADRELKESMFGRELTLKERDQARLEKALDQDIGTTAAKLGISQQELQITRDKIAQDADQFTKTLQNKQDEYDTNIQIAITKQNSEMITDLVKSIGTDLTAIENNMTRLQGSATAGMMDPETYKKSMNDLAAQQKALRSQLTGLRSHMSDKLNLPTDQSDAVDPTDPFNLRKK